MFGKSFRNQLSRVKMLTSTLTATMFLGFAGTTVLAEEPIIIEEPEVVLEESAD